MYHAAVQRLRCLLLYPIIRFRRMQRLGSVLNLFPPFLGRDAILFSGRLPPSLEQGLPSLQTRQGVSLAAPRDSVSCNGCGGKHLESNVNSCGPSRSPAWKWHLPPLFVAKALAKSKDESKRKRASLCSGWALWKRPHITLAPFSEQVVLTFLYTFISSTRPLCVQQLLFSFPKDLATQQNICLGPL